MKLPVLIVSSNPKMYLLRRGFNLNEKNANTWVVCYLNLDHQTHDQKIFSLFRGNDHLDPDIWMNMIEPIRSRFDLKNDTRLVDVIFHDRLWKAC